MPFEPVHIPVLEISSCPVPNRFVLYSNAMTINALMSRVVATDAVAILPRDITPSSPQVMSTRRHTIKNLHWFILQVPRRQVLLREQGQVTELGPALDPIGFQEAVDSMQPLFQTNLPTIGD
jgi:hypothetical protein